jgi:hypothetical protein
MPGCTPYIHDLLDVVSEGMLRVKPEDRVSARKLLHRLEEMDRKGAAEPSYLTKPQPGVKGPGKNCDDKWTAARLNPEIYEIWQRTVMLAQAVKEASDGATPEPEPRVNHPIVAEQNPMRMWLLFLFWRVLGFFLG